MYTAAAEVGKIFGGGGEIIRRRADGNPAAPAWRVFRRRRRNSAAQGSTSTGSRTIQGNQRSVDLNPLVNGHFRRPCMATIKFGSRASSPILCTLTKFRVDMSALFTLPSP